MPKKTVRLTADIPEDLHTQLRVYAALKRLSITSAAEELLSRSLQESKNPVSEEATA